MNTERIRPLSRRRVLCITGGVALAAGVLSLAIDFATGWPVTRRLGIILTILGAFWLLMARFASGEPLRANQRRYLREVLPAVAAYLVLVLAFKPLLDQFEQPLVRAGIALLPVLPMLFMLRAVVRKLLGGDELERRMQLEAVSIASLGVGLLTYAVGFMDMAGVLHLDQALLLVLPGLFLAYALALQWVRRRYRGP